MDSRASVPMHRGRFTSRGFSLSYLDTAPDDKDRPVMLFLHGFPDVAEMWIRQMEFMHEQGYRCIAPDTVGCGESEIAPRLGDYHAIKIAGDSAALLEHLGIAKVDVVGHDWGAVLAWLFAGHFPSRVRKLMVMSVGHPMAYARAGWDQKIAAWYIVFFLMAGLAEKLLLGNGKLSLSGVFKHPHADEVMARMREPGRMTAALRIYRASLATVLLKKQPRISADVYGLYSRGDAFLVESQMRNSEKWVDGAWKQKSVEGGHWMPLDQPDMVNGCLQEWFL